MDNTCVLSIKNIINTFIMGSKNNLMDNRCKHVYNSNFNFQLET